MAKSKPKTLLFVCTGNTCRSPMAERLMAHLCRGLEGWTFGSVGVFAAEGAPAAANAVAALHEKGVDLNGHRARQLTPALAASADMLVAMTRAHIPYILEIAPESASKCRTLHSFGTDNPQGDVMDPMGSGIDTYRITRDEISSALTDLILALYGPKTT